MNNFSADDGLVWKPRKVEVKNMEAKNLSNGRTLMATTM